MFTHFLALDENYKEKIFLIEKIPRGKYVRYDGILKRLKVYLFGKIFDEVLACCIKNHKKILGSVKSLFRFFREEFSINVSKHFNRLFIREKLWEILEIIFYSKHFNKIIDVNNNIDDLKQKKDENIQTIMEVKIFNDFTMLGSCETCKKHLSKKYLEIVEDFKTDEPRFKDYLNDLKRQGYNNKYLKQFDEIVSDFELYMGQAKKKKYLKDNCELDRKFTS